MNTTIKYLSCCSLLLWAGSALALSSDREQPATIEADEVEFDFKEGTRTYIGNVTVEQGTLYVTGDKIVVVYDGSEVVSATAWGTPATFKQLPDGKEDEVYGEGNTIVVDQTSNTLTMIEEASLTQAGNTALGREIIYDMESDKMRVKGFKQPPQGDGEETTTTETGRARVVITPESKDKGDEAVENLDPETQEALESEISAEIQESMESDSEAEVQDEPSSENGTETESGWKTGSETESNAADDGTSKTE